MREQAVRTTAGEGVDRVVAAASKDLTVREAILAAAELNSGVPEQRQTADAGPGSGAEAGSGPGPASGPRPGAGSVARAGSESGSGPGSGSRAGSGPEERRRHG